VQAFFSILPLQLVSAVVAIETGGVDRVRARGVVHRETGEAGVAAEDAIDPPAVAAIAGNRVRI